MAESSRNLVAIVAIIAIVVLVGVVVWLVREETNDTLEIDIGTSVPGLVVPAGDGKLAA
jgi:hypothetical protein